MENIILHVYYRGEAGAAAAFVQEMKMQGLQNSVQHEDGNLQYDYFLSSEEADTVLLLEKWRDEVAFSEHRTHPNMGKIQSLKAKYGLTTTLERYE